MKEKKRKEAWKEGRKQGSELVRKNVVVCGMGVGREKEMRAGRIREA